jgi:hypothetical protein
LKQRNGPKNADTFGYKFISFSAKQVFILALFGLATVLATFQKYWAIFFPNQLVTLIRSFQSLSFQATSHLT